MAPFRPAQEDDEFMDDTPAKVMALSWGQGDRTSATHMVVVETNHRLNHSCTFSKLGDRDREADMEKFSDKVAIYEPDVIVLAGFHPGILTHLYNIVSEIVNKGRSRKKFSKQIPIILVDDDAARVFMNSKEGQKYYPDSDPMVRYLVSLARKVQDPIMEYSRLMNVEDDYKHLHLHPLQKLVRFNN
jgi:transcription elongation factor SPT6